MPQEPLTLAALRAAELNSQTRALSTYGAHRQRVMQLIGLANERLSSLTDTSIVVLGAGNCLDLNLKNLANQFHRIELLDIDRAALEFAVTSQAVKELHHSETKVVRLIAPFDFAQPSAQLSVEEFSDPAQWLGCRTTSAALLGDALCTV